MERLYTCCCGLDAHKQTVVACLLRPTPDGQSTRETRTFPTTTDSLLALSDWLRATECTHVAIESTGV
jgi:transposase